jgi:REP element-mobilizing transposase RayT
MNMPLKSDPQKHHRRSVRLKEYDYSQAGAYFVTIVAHQRACLFGKIMDRGMKLNNIGEIIANTWKWLADQYPYVEPLHGVVMPNHFHGLLMIHDDGRGGSRSAPTGTKRKPLGRLIGAFKTVSTKQINLLRQTEGAVVWQRNYYEHIVRNEKEMDHIWKYIEANPSMWAEDDENPLKAR